MLGATSKSGTIASSTVETVRPFKLKFKARTPGTRDSSVTIGYGTVNKTPAKRRSIERVL